MTSASLAYRGRLIGILLMLLGTWGALIPFVGPYFHFGFTPDRVWVLTSGSLWLSVAPGAAAFLGGLLTISTDRGAVAGSFLAALGGGWYVLGLPIVGLWFSHTISAGAPVYEVSAPFRPEVMTFLERLGYFYGLGVVVLFFAAVAFGEVIVARMAALRYQDRINAAIEHQDGYNTAAY